MSVPTELPIPDAGLAVLLTDHGRAWQASTAPVGEHGRIAYLVPAAEPYAGAWHVTVIDTKAGAIDGTKRPVLLVGVELTLRYYGIDPAALDWQPFHGFGPCSSNPFFNGAGNDW